MNAFHDLAQMTRDYGLTRYFAMTVAVVSALMLALFLWGRVPDPAGPPEAPVAAPSSQ
jgi:hypothetical protein